ncbi:MAG: hypothetical protein C5B51_06475 [Terriglobia bacterium]|nr:MAG: hypothetical protein C5B51_06475 [Terriglobia bacterium]
MSDLSPLGNQPLDSVINKLQPHRTLHLQGASAYGAGAALWGASETGFTVSGVFRDAADFAVLVLWDRDDFFGHPRWSYLPDGNFTGLCLDFDVTFEGIFPFESRKPAWTDCASINATLTDGTNVRKPLLQGLATGPLGRPGATGTFTLNTGGAIAPYDRVTLWYQNLAFDYVAAGDEGTAEICSALAAQINGTDWTANGPVALSAAASTNQITIVAEPGTDGNMVTLYELHKNPNLLFTPAAVQLSGGSSDNVPWHVRVDFSALGWLDLQKLWLTFAPALPNGCPNTSSEWRVVVSNWMVTDTLGTRRLRVAGPNSVRIEEDSDWVKFSGYWEPAPEEKGVFSQGRALRAAQPGAAATVATHCGQAHDIYIGTRLDFDCGKVDVLLDGVAATAPIDCYRPSAQAQSRIRRKVYAGVAAGQHSLQVRIRSDRNPLSQGTYYYFDFVECVVASDVPDAPAVRDDVAVATDFDTDHAYKCSPERLVWAIQKSGLVGNIDHYAGVFWWKQAVAVGGNIPSARIACNATADAFVNIGGWTIGKSVFPADTPQTVAAHFAYFINEAASGVWADTDGNGTLRIYCRSANFAFTCTASGGASVIGGSLSGGVAPAWQIDANASPIFNRAFRDWHADFFATLRAAGMQAIVSFSQELVQAPDNPPAAVWYQRFWDNTPVATATGFQSLYSSQCAFSQAVLNYMQSAYEAMAGLMESAGLTARLQFGEILWWFNANPSGMAYYDADTQGAFQTAYGRALAHFLTPNDNPAVNASVDANFLRARLANYVQGIQSYVLSKHPNAVFELLWPLDVNLPETKRLNWYVNLPPAWKQKNGSGFTSFLCEGFQFGGIDHNVDLVSRCAAYPFNELAWNSADCGYLMGLFNPGWPWEREFLASRRRLPAVIKMWAYDHICLYGRCIPLPTEARTAIVQTGN